MIEDEEERLSKIEKLFNRLAEEKHEQTPTFDFGDQVVTTPNTGSDSADQPEVSPARG